MQGPKFATKSDIYFWYFTKSLVTVTNKILPLYLITKNIKGQGYKSPSVAKL